MIPSNDQLEIVRVALGVGLGISNVAVWWGVYLERDKFPKETQDRGWRILIRALAAEAALAFALLAVDTTIGLRQKEEIAALNEQISPRTLTHEQASAVSENLKSFAGTSVVFFVYPADIEARRFAEQLGAALVAARFRIVQTVPVPPETNSATAKLVVGVQISSSPATAPVRDALISLLNDDRILATADRTPFEGNRWLLIWVGVRPLPTIAASAPSESHQDPARVRKRTRT